MIALILERMIKQFGIVQLDITKIIIEKKIFLISKFTLDISN